MSTERSSRSATRGLATVALLKVNFDAGRDHLAMFEPFVADTIAHMDCDGLRVDDIRAAILERHQLALPVDTLRTLLHRVAKAGFLRREAGRYFRTDKKPEINDLRVKRQRVEDRQRRLAEALREASAERGVKVATAEDALEMILSFLEQYHVSLALDGGADPCAKVGDEPSEEPDRDRRAIMTASFLQETVLAEGELAEVV